MAAALQKQLGKSENLLAKNLVYLWWRQMQTRPFVAVGKPEINGSNERHRAHEQTCFVSFGGVMAVASITPLPYSERTLGAASSELGAHY